jgi:tRNA threonylcarbamoyladenosine biosynthesis protein TsaE
MSKHFQAKVQLNNQQQTEEFAALLGSRLSGGEVIELISDLGGGKTTFVKGLVQGAGSGDHVSSPSFTLRNDYGSAKMAIAHFDFYRLSDPGILKEMLAEAMLDPQTVVVIEWAGIIEDILPKDHIKITISVTAETKRQLALDLPSRFSYLVEGLIDVPVN